MVLPLADLAHDIPVLGPIGVGVATLNGTPSLVLAADAQRRGVVFHNPGSNNLRVSPVGTVLSGNAGGILIYPQSDFVFFADDEHVNVNAAWNAWVDSGSGQPISILNFTSANFAAAAPMPLASLNQGSAITSPNATGVLVGTSSIPAIGANPQRRGITFHNAGTVAMAVCPANLVAQIGAGSIVILPGASKTYMAQARSKIRVNCGWNVIAQSGGGNPLTILEHLG